MRWLDFNREVRSKIIVCRKWAISTMMSNSIFTRHALGQAYNPGSSRDKRWSRLATMASDRKFNQKTWPTVFSVKTEREFCGTGFVEVGVVIVRIVRIFSGTINNGCHRISVPNEKQLDVVQRCSIIYEAKLSLGKNRQQKAISKTLITDRLHTYFTERWQILK